MNSISFYKSHLVSQKTAGRVWVGIVFLGILFLGTRADAQETDNAQSDQRLSPSQALEQFDETLAAVAQKRKALHRRWQKASGKQRKLILAEAKTFILDTLDNRIFPAWMGMPWTMAVIPDGLKPNAAVPYEENKGISCSWFVVSTLRNAGFRFISPSRFAGTIAVHFQNSLTPNKRHFHRYWQISPKQLHDKFLKLGDGLYVIGLNCHIGFVRVQGDSVDFIHSNYVSPNQVTREPLISSDAISFSEDTGYVVSALFHDNYLVSHWLSKQKIPFKKKKK